MTAISNTRRQLAFVAGEDYNFLAYSVVLILVELGCISSKSLFVDYRKIAFLADVVSVPAAHRLTIGLLEATDPPRRPHPMDLRYLTLVYDRGEARKPFLARVVQALHKRSIIHIANDTDIFVTDSAAARQLAGEPIFGNERKKISALRRTLPQLKRMSLATTKLRLFGAFGVRTWDDA